MKSKPISHKCDNTFKFESFNERLNKINVSSINHLKRRFDSAENDEEISFFALALEKWQDLNCTNDYRQLRIRLGSSNDVRNLVQILHRKKEITEILLEELRNKETGALNAVLELIVALARDLQTEFYEYFPVIFQLLVEFTCRANDADSIEQLFVCQTFLFKYLWKPILADIVDYFKIFRKALTIKKDYVVNFSSETFSFLIRKSKEPENLFALLFKSLVEDSQLVKPVGRILFESIKGVKQMYYSKAKIFLDIIFTQYLQSELEILDASLECFLEYLLEYSSNDSFKLLYHYLLLDISKLKKCHIAKTIRLLKLVIEHKKCHFITDPLKVLSSLVDYLFKLDLDQPSIQNVLAAVSNLFIYKYSELDNKVIESFAKQFYSIQSTKASTVQILTFTRNILSSPIIEKIINTYLFRYFSDIFQFRKTFDIQLSLEFLSYLILYKKKRPLFGQELYKVGKYTLLFEDCDFLFRTLSDIIKNSTDLKTIWFALIILPNLSSTSNVSGAIQLIKDNLLSKIENYFESGNIGLPAHILLESIISLTILKSSSSLITEIQTKQIVQLIRKYPDSFELLQCLDIYLTYNSGINNEDINAYLPDIYPILLKHFSSPYRVKRILSLHLMTLFDLKLPKCEIAENAKPRNVFQICLDAELVPLDLNSYRERLRHVGNLDKAFVSPQVPLPVNGVDFSSASIYFLLGCLYENFSLLWKPITEVLNTYAQLAKDRKQFTDVIFDHYHQTNRLVSENKTAPLVCLFNQHFGLKLYDDLYNLNSKPDCYNHRVWLLKSFELFPELIEQRNREFVELFFNFLNTELTSQFIFGVTFRENFKSIQKDDSEEIESNKIEVDEAVDEDECETSTKKIKANLWKTLFQYLRVFSKFKNPKALYREPELLQLYLNMLLSPNSSIQKHSLDCIFTYDYEHLRKYKENFYNLVDDKKFKSEIHTFLLSDNKDDNVLIEEHRSKVIPFFFRILYGKMLSSSGAKVHGKSKIDFMRSIVMKILASFNEDEQIIFLELVFTSFHSLVEVDHDQLWMKINNFVDIEAFIPFRQFLSMINTLEHVMRHFGSKSVKVMRHMFKLLIICSSISNILLSDKYRCQIKKFMINSLKTFRTNCFKVASYFLSHFDKYPFSPTEIDLLFDALITPLLSTLHVDSFNSPSPLLKLFLLISENPRYHILFSKCIESGVTPISNVIQLYSNEKTSSATVNYITNIVENLLTFNLMDTISGNKEQTVQPIEIKNKNILSSSVTDYSELADKNINTSIGSILLIPFISSILDRIQRNYHLNLSKKNHKFAFTLQEVNVMARLSFFIKSPIDSKTVSILLLHSISQTRRPEEDKEVFTLKTLNHLAKNLNPIDFEEILRLVIPLFHIIDKPLSRRELGEFLCTLSQLNNDFLAMAKLVRDINTFDVRLPEEPDYNKRIAAFKEILLSLDFLNCNLSTLQTNYIQVLLENCSFTINNYDDMSLRELSSNVISKICQLFSEAKEDVFNRFVMNSILYGIISRGLRQEKENIRHEYIDILINAVKLFPSKHPIIDQLRSLCNDEDDEVDFWLNIKHIQLHRRARALTRLCMDTEKLASMGNRVYTDFLIPLVNHFINDTEHYAKNVTLTNAAIDSLAIFLQYCSWHKFETTLSHYINGLLNAKLDTKISIRVISAFLEKFSFLKTDIVAKIEAELNADYFKSLAFEYNSKKTTSNSKGKKNKFGKKGKKKKSEEIEDKVEELKKTEMANVEEEEESIVVEETETKDKINYYKKIYNVLCNKLLPLLHKCLHQHSQIEHQYDSHQDEFPEDEEIQRIPIALAVVRLLKHVHLNEHLLITNLTSIFLRICQFLQSRTESIRDAARNTLAQILKLLGPKYFSNIFYDMRSLLTRGYQRHIFIYTVHSLLSHLTDQMKCGDLDKCLEDIIEVCHMELFTSLAEEKEISQIVTKTKEARKHKGYDIYEIIAQFVSESSLKKLIAPLKEVLSETNNYKKLKVVDNAFHKIGRGLNLNTGISIGALVDMLIEIFATTRPDVENLVEEHKVKSLHEKLPKKVDSLVISTKMFRRNNQTSKINRLSNNFILSDFALNCFLYLVKSNRLNKEDPIHLALLEQSIKYLNTFLHSKDTKVVTTTLNCLHTLLLKFPDLKSFSQTSQSIVSQIFILLNKYSGMSNDDSQLTVLCFKTIAYFINTRSECKLNNEEIVVLLSYAEKDIENNSHNSTIYFLLKSIIARKFVCKQLHVLMERMVFIAITTEVDHVRSHAIELSIKYLTEYPIESTRFKGKIVKLVRQLDYESLHGRLAAIRILKGVVHYLNYDVIHPLVTFIFVPIVSRLFNEDSSECKKLVADVVRQIISKVTKEDRTQLVKSFITPWLTSDDIMTQTLASILLTIFATYEKADFEPRISDCLPYIRQQLEPTRFASLKSVTNLNEEGEEERSQAPVKSEDLLIFHHLTFFLNILNLPNALELLTKGKHFENMNQLVDYTMYTYLLHPHTWVRHLGMQIFGKIFALFPPESFIRHVNLYKNFCLFQNPEETMKKLCTKLCLVLRDLYSCESCSEQLAKNLVYMAKVFILFKFDGQPIESLSDDQVKPTLEWLINKMIFEIKFEIKDYPEVYKKRNLVFKWIAAVSIELGTEKLMSYLPTLLMPLCRQDLITSNSTVSGESQKEFEELVNLNKEILQLIRKLVGSESFIDQFNLVRNRLSSQRLERRKQRAVQMVTQTDVGVKRKLLKHKRSQEAKKRKIASYKH